MTGHGRIIIFALITLFLLVLGGIQWWAWRNIERDLEWQYVRDVLIDQEEGNNKFKAVSRHPNSPQYLFFNPQQIDPKLIENFINDINKAFKDTHFNLKVTHERKRADIIIISAKTKKAARAALEKVKCRLLDDLSGLSCKRIKYGYIRQVHIWASKKLPTLVKKATLLHELLHALGFGGHSNVALDSVMSFGTPTYNTATRLNALELKTLFLLYQYLEPGHREADVRKAFDLHWSGINVQ